MLNTRVNPSFVVLSDGNSDASYVSLQRTFNPNLGWGWLDLVVHHGVSVRDGCGPG